MFSLPEKKYCILWLKIRWFGLNKDVIKNKNKRGLKVFIATVCICISHVDDGEGWYPEQG